MHAAKQNSVNPKYWLNRLLAGGTIFYIFLFLFLTTIYCSIRIVITFDSAHYLKYIDIFNQVDPWTSWDVVRGIVFPYILHLSIKLFGHSHTSALFLTYLFFIGFAILSVVFLKILLNNKIGLFVRIIFITLILVNPIILGFYHTLLTEFVATTLSILMIVVTYHWMQTSFSKSKRDYLGFSAVIIILVSFSYHLKQPYLALTLPPLCLGTAFSIWNRCNLFNLIERGLVFCVAITLLIVSIFSWHSFLPDSGPAANKTRSSYHIVSNFAMRGIGQIHRIELISLDFYSIENVVSDNNIKQIDKREAVRLLKLGEYVSKQYRFVNIIKEGEVIDKLLIWDVPADRTILSSFRIFRRIVLNHPQLAFSCYWDNFSKSIRLKENPFNEVILVAFRSFTFKKLHENVFLTLPEYQKYVRPYRRNPINVVGKLPYTLFKEISLLLFPILLSMFSIYWLLSISFGIYRSIRRKARLHFSSYQTAMCLASFSVFSIVFIHVISGLVNDRYSYPGYPISILLFITVVGKAAEFINTRFSREAIIRNS